MSSTKECQLYKNLNNLVKTLELILNILLHLEMDWVAMVFLLKPKVPLEIKVKKIFS